MIIESIACDQCTAILDGVSGTARIKKPYISIAGKIAQSAYNEEFRTHVHVFLMDKGVPRLYFCNATCLANYINQQYARRKEWVEGLVRNRRDYENDY